KPQDWLGWLDKKAKDLPRAGRGEGDPRVADYPLFLLVRHLHLRPLPEEHRDPIGLFLALHNIDPNPREILELKGERPARNGQMACLASHEFEMACVFETIAARQGELESHLDVAPILGRLTADQRTQLVALLIDCEVDVQQAVEQEQPRHRRY